MESVILEISLCLIENIIIYVFLNSLLKSRFRSVLPLILAIIATTIVDFLILNLITVLRFSVSLVYILICESVLYKDKLVVKITYALISLYSYSITDIILGNILSLILGKGITDIFFAYFTYRVVFSLTAKVADALIFFIFYKMLNRIDKNMRSKFWSLFAVVVFVMLVICTVFLYIYPSAEQNTASTALYTTLSTLFFAMSLIIVYFFCEICAGFQHDKRLFALESNYRALEETIAAQSINSENLRKIRHDITKHTANAVALIESGKTDDAITLLKNTGEAAETIIPKYNINTGNNVVDAIISSKAALCESKGIMFSYQIEPLKDIRIDTVDLSSLLSNLMDNAIEAAEKTVNGYIKIEIFKYKAYYDICVENSFMGKDSVSYSGLQLLSTKTDNVMHGYGTQIIEDIARKYDGNFSWRAQDSKFISTVLIKI